ncbi:beta-sandwich domain-containing protein [Bdellovibrio sp. SKB1291214]|uniref:beta-sandwich domain-containing protein n=1 Tax=Bdellovibrio sp. SKB1291214 TaxID=1732569 RepID=UPI000B518251|nr:beta-sandwich domain-containing protein [Bdellovibrio sp. SKB1291214]UYL09313.1 beta-sandwich domain-containing protein [Bdellovibrio sp. SKB1291214]
MELLWTKRIIASILVLQAPALVHAGSTGADELRTWAAQSQYEGSARISDITRKGGGDLYRLDLAKPIPLSAIKAKVKSGKVKVISIQLVNEKNERIALKAFNNVVLADSDKELLADNASSNLSILGIEIQAEAMGGNASLDINAISKVEAPKLALRNGGGNGGNNGNNGNNGDDNSNSCSRKYDAILKEKLDIIQLWAGRAEASAVGSWQEKYASKEFTKFVNEFIASIKSEKTSVASTEYTLTLLNFFTERHNASRPDSAADQGYKALATETFEVFLASLQGDQTCRVVTSDSLIKIALDFQKRQDANKPDSRARKVYEVMIGQIGKLIPSHYRKEIASKNLNFRQADTEGYKYYKLFASSKADSFLKGTYQEMSVNAYSVAEQSLLKEVKSLNNEQTYQLIVEFQTKYNDPANYPQEIMLKYLTILSDHSNFLKFMATK